ncbi:MULTISPECIES: hypothetical protein [Halorussus]|uniref:hypothetical protein n=1 Tax=Halorussus TaxID=1070314 RepID=UPI0020A08587|nr:hypothetical protein [Halorussus vallis]USZ78636.1 hypothetical protein NGM07_25135 [Halorussus vallis]USZ78667.1 hypothetical protein NGM07_24465 [Halorussus vallis]
MDRDVFSGRSIAKGVSIGLFFALVLVFLVLSVAANSVVIVVFAGVILSQFLYVVLPIQRIRGKAHRLWTGEAGEDAYEDAQSYRSKAWGWFK